MKKIFNRRGDLSRNEDASHSARIIIVVKHRYENKNQLTKKD